jgi:hypothetical protein
MIPRWVCIALCNMRRRTQISRVNLVMKAVMRRAEAKGMEGSLKRGLFGSEFGKKRRRG